MVNDSLFIIRGFPFLFLLYTEDASPRESSYQLVVSLNFLIFHPLFIPLFSTGYDIVNKLIIVYRIAI